MTEFIYRDDPALPNVVELREVGQTYDGGKNWVLRDVNFVIEDKPGQGQFVVILGMSGSGKSTILRYIAGIQQPSVGEVFIHGLPSSRSKPISMVFQQYSSLPWLTVLDNVALALRFEGMKRTERNARAMEMIRLVGLEGHEYKYAQYPSLSGGQLQRVAIARSIIANPSIVLMDEPFGALDIQTRMQMQELLLKLWDRFHFTVVFVTHDINEAVFLGDDIYILKSVHPSNFVRHIPVDLPLSRTMATKRDLHFMELVHRVEDAMIEVGRMV